ncbi:MAG: TldD/PmbA family protein [Spirochaetia bacterium]|nr:TldD/PmbA family protein [Spirochaetia bacterium]
MIKEFLLKIIDKQLVPSELYYSRGKEIEISAFNGSINNFTSAETSGVGARVAVDGKIGSAFTESVTEQSVSAILRKAGENSKYSAFDEGNVLYSGKELPDSEEFMSKDIGSIPVDRKKEVALNLEQSAKEYDSRIINVPYAYYQEISSETGIVSTEKTAAFRRASLCGAMLYVMASDGKDTQVGSAVRLYQNFSGIDTALLVKEASDKAISMLGAGELSTGTYNIILDEQVASKLLGVFIAGGSSHFFGENIQKNRSRFKGEPGEKIGCELFTLKDNPLSGSLRSKTFDDEGVPTRSIVLAERGILKSVIHSVYSAARAGVDPTGHSQRGGFSGGVATGLHDAYITNGTDDQEALLQQLDSGILITEVEGLHAGLDPITGDFSLSAKGYRVSHGNQGDPVRNFTIAGNFFEFINRISEKADDRRTDRMSAFSSPSLLISDVSISG